MARPYAWLILGAGCTLLVGCLGLPGSQDTSAILTQPETQLMDSMDLNMEGAEEQETEESVPSLPPQPISDYKSRVLLPVEKEKITEQEQPKEAKSSSSVPAENIPTTQPVKNPGIKENVIPTTFPEVEMKPGTSRESYSAPPPVPLKPKESPLDSVLRTTVEKHPEEVKKLLEKADKLDHSVLRGLLRLTAELSEQELQKLTPEEVATTLDRIQELTLQLRQRAILSLGKVCLCKSIEGFGRCELIPADYEFQAGTQGQPGERVRVYTEVRNFTCRRVEGEYETMLACSLEICDAERNRISLMNLGTCVDRSQSLRQDYFLNFQFHVPPRLRPGIYTLWVTVKDVTPNTKSDQPQKERITRRSIDFRVKVPATVAVADK